MDFVSAFFPHLLTVLLYILPVWLLWRAVRSLEKIASKIEQIPDNENTRK